MGVEWKLGPLWCLQCLDLQTLEGQMHQSWHSSCRLPAKTSCLENLEFFGRHTHCKHILLGYHPRDDSDVPVLSSWNIETSIMSRMSLIQPFRLGENAENLFAGAVQFNTIFRDPELPAIEGPLAQKTHFIIPKQTPQDPRISNQPNQLMPPSFDHVAQSPQSVATSAGKRPRTPSIGLSRGPAPTCPSTSSVAPTKSTGVSLSNGCQSASSTHGFPTPPLSSTEDGYSYEERYVC